MVPSHGCALATWMNASECDTRRLDVDVVQEAVQCLICRLMHLMWRAAWLVFPIEQARKPRMKSYANGLGESLGCPAKLELSRDVQICSMIGSGLMLCKSKVARPQPKGRQWDGPFQPKLVETAMKKTPANFR